MTFFFLIASTLNISICFSLLIGFPFVWEVERMLGSLSKVFSSRSFQAFSFDIWKSNPRHLRRYLHILGEFLTFFLSVLNFHALPIIYSYWKPHCSKWEKSSRHIAIGISVFGDLGFDEIHTKPLNPLRNHSLTPFSHWFEALILWENHLLLFDGSFLSFVPWICLDFTHYHTCHLRIK